MTHGTTILLEKSYSHIDLCDNITHITHITQPYKKYAYGFYMVLLYFANSTFTVYLTLYYIR
jgi:hypothetical protein